MPNYGDPQYWEERYTNVYTSAESSIFDWLEDYETLKEIITQTKIPKTAKILNIGCGNSAMSEKMYDDGYTNIINIDISHTVIKYMKERNKNREGMEWLVMDVMDMKSIPDNSIDLVIDKSTIDALLCGNDSDINVAKMIKEVQRVLKCNRDYMIISYGAPENRLMHLERNFLKFDIKVYTISKSYEEEEGFDNYHYIYLSKKLPGADEQSQQFFEETLVELAKDEELEEQIHKGIEEAENSQ